MEKVGNGKNLEEILDRHIEKINKTVAKNDELEKFCVKIDSDIKNCIQKVGIYRYNAYKDTGSEMSNIYAKPIENGASPYKITEEESEAIKRAINSQKTEKFKNIVKSIDRKSINQY